jgi:2-methylcitrate dehydratase PrpD
MTDDAAWVLARHVCGTGYADLPASAVASARRDILDTFGCMLGGSGSPGIDELFAVIARWGGREESRVLLRGTRLPAPQAALLNASMGHALDFDDTLDTGGSIHPGVSVLVSVLAVCDSPGGVSGRPLHAAIDAALAARAQLNIERKADDRLAAARRGVLGQLRGDVGEGDFERGHHVDDGRRARGERLA